MEKRQLLVRVGIVIAVILAVLAGWGGVINAGPRAEMKKAVQAEKEAREAAAAEASAAEAAVAEGVKDAR